jgi:hypothetical protein
VKRRRIREIVAAAASAAGEPTSPSEITVTVRRPEDPAPGVGINVLWGVAAGTSKREALEVALAAHGWEREWPALTDAERFMLREGVPGALDVLHGLNGAELGMHPDLWFQHLAVMEHLREPVALPEEASRG